MGDEIKALLDKVTDIANESVEKHKEIEVRVNTRFESVEKELHHISEAVKSNTFNQDVVEAAVVKVLEKDREKDVRRPNMVDTREAGLAAMRMIPDVRKDFAYDDLVLEKETELWDNYDPAYLLSKGAKGFKRFMAIPAQDDLHCRFQRLMDDAKLMRDIMAVTHGKRYRGFDAHCPKMARRVKAAIGAVLQHYSAKSGEGMDTTDTGNWIPDGWSSELIEMIKLGLIVAAQFERFTMPQDPFKMPMDFTDTIGHLVAETSNVGWIDLLTDTNAQKLDDQVLTLSAKKLRARMLISGELQEDALLAMLPLIRRRLVEILQNSEETAILNGDTAGTHMDSDVTAATDPRKAFLGLRAWCLDIGATAKLDLSGGLPDGGDFLDLRAKLGEYGVMPDQLFYLTGIKLFLKTLNMTDGTTGNNPLVVTRDKAGDAATFFTGQLGIIWGAPFIVSRYSRENLNAAGVYDGVTTTMGSVLCVNKRAWIIGDRREVSIESTRIAAVDQEDVVAFQRLAFSNVFDATAAGSRVFAALAYNTGAL